MDKVGPDLLRCPCSLKYMHTSLAAGAGRVGESVRAGGPASRLHGTCASRRADLLQLQPAAHRAHAGAASQGRGSRAGHLHCQQAVRTGRSHGPCQVLMPSLTLVRHSMRVCVDHLELKLVFLCGTCTCNAEYRKLIVVTMCWKCRAFKLATYSCGLPLSTWGTHGTKRAIPCAYMQ